MTPEPPFLPRAVAPPVGDIAISNIDTAPELIDLGTDVLVPRLVLKEAPAREVLALLARSAGLNLIYTGADAGAGEEGAAVDTTISLDLENESVQEVFNYVLQVSGLEASRRGESIFVGAALPSVARNMITRSFRLNQTTAANAAAFLAAQGAEARQVIERTTIETQEAIEAGTAVVGEGDDIEGEGIDFITRETEIDINTLTVEGDVEGPLLLEGLTVISDDRLNSVTLVGEPRKVQIATSFLTQLDARRRQVAVNVKVIDINLLSTEDFGTSFSFGIGNNLIEFGGADGLTARFSDPTFDSDLTEDDDFLLELEAQITNGNAKILTDPTLVVQEGQAAGVRLTQEVFGGTEVQFIEVGEQSVAVEVPIIKQAGLILDILVDQIDDNGFITLAVNPTVSSIAGSESTPLGDITLLQQRTVTSGEIRVRDGQTLILSGIIQESEQVSVSKVPILGDLPLLGALFRDTNRTDQRNEVIVLLTPQILDDSEYSTFGYNYTPGRETRQILQEGGFPVQGR
jgi:type IV pilus assembly protein PilQ